MDEFLLPEALLPEVDSGSPNADGEREVEPNRKNVPASTTAPKTNAANPKHLPEAQRPAAINLDAATELQQPKHP